MRNLFTLRLKNALSSSPLPQSSTAKAEIWTGPFSEEISSGFYASVSTGHSFPSTIAGSLENSVTEHRDLSSSFLGGATESTTIQAVVRSR